MNLATLKTWMARFTGDSNQSRYNAQQYLDSANEAQLQFALDTKSLFKDYAFSVVANQSYYPLPADFMYEKKVSLSTINNSTGGIALTGITIAQLEFIETDHDWTQDTGTPQMYIINPETAQQTICLYPQPQGADAGINNCLMTYYPYPALLANPADIPLNATPLLVQFHMAIAEFGAYLLLTSEIATPEITQKMSTLHSNYEKKVTECIDLFGNTVSAPLRLSGGRSWH